MSVPSESPRGGGGLGLLLVFGAGIAFAIFLPIGLLTVPLAGLVLVTRFQRLRAVVTASLLTGISLWWLAQSGDPPDQVIRAAAVLGSGAFVVTFLSTSWSLTHRSLAAIGVAAGGTGALLAATRTSWPEIHWWVESRGQLAAQLVLTRLSGDQPGAGDDAMVVQLKAWFESVIPLMADFFPATVAVQMLAGLALATALYRRFAPAAGVTPGKFRDFRFSEHLGWIAVIALAIVLLTRAATVKLMAANVLVVASLLYALRGAAVAWFGLTLAGGPGLLTTGLVAFSVVFMLPVILIGTIFIGVVDAGLDLRRRWPTPQERT
jgi:hypothetical protein